jgi:NAD(P)-dependent dehydrogenase (short-subunit alcohol dehydrogenase family)
MASAPQPKIVLVTGANQGLGHAVIEVGGTRYPDNVYILGSRDLDKGKEAARKLEELGVKARVDVVQLDVTNDEHIEAAVRHVEKTYGRLDGTQFLGQSPTTCIQPPTPSLLSAGMAYT